MYTIIWQVRVLNEIYLIILLSRQAMLIKQKQMLASSST